jgi:hypothetical protein
MAALKAISAVSLSRISPISKCFDKLSMTKPEISDFLRELQNCPY